MDTSDGFFDRWIIVDFNYRYVDKHEFDLADSDLKQQLRIKDPSVEERISTQEELNGFLNYALQGLHRLLKNGEFSNSATMQEVKMKWLRKSSSVMAFFQDCCEKDRKSHITKEEFREAYLDYCDKHDLNAENDKKIYPILTETLGLISKQMSIDGEITRAWKGIKFNGNFNSFNRFNTVFPL